MLGQLLLAGRSLVVLQGCRGGIGSLWTKVTKYDHMPRKDPEDPTLKPRGGVHLVGRGKLRHVCL